MPTWPHVLRQAGYATSLSGGMHFVGHDQLHGFERRVHPDIAQLLVPCVYGDWDKPQADDHVMLTAVKSAGPKQEPTKGQQFDAAVTDAAIEELSFLTTEDSRPWALTVGLHLPHFEYAVSQDYYDLYEGVDIPMPRPPPNGQTYEEVVPAQLADNRKWLGLTTDGATEEEVRMARRCYYGMISCVDHQIGRLLSHLDELGEADNTWVIYLSDHGDNMGEHGFWSKLNFYEDSVRVPLIIAPPACANPGTQCEAPVSLVDWMSTILDLTGQQEEFEELPGCSLLPLIEDPSQQWPERVVVADYACGGTRVPMRMIRRGKWKAWFALNLPPMLFNLEEDPHEFDDLSRDDSTQSILEELHALACSSGWDAEALREEILLHKRRMKYINAAETT